MQRSSLWPISVDPSSESDEPLRPKEIDRTEILLDLEADNQPFSDAEKKCDFSWALTSAPQPKTTEQQSNSLQSYFTFRFLQVPPDLFSWLKAAPAQCNMIEEAIDSSQVIYLQKFSS